MLLKGSLLCDLATSESESLLSLVCKATDINDCHGLSGFTCAFKRGLFSPVSRSSRPSSPPEDPPPWPSTAPPSCSSHARPSASPHWVKFTAPLALTCSFIFSQNVVSFFVVFLCRVGGGFVLRRSQLSCRRSAVLPGQPRLPSLCQQKEKLHQGRCSQEHEGPCHDI